MLILREDNRGYYFAGAIKNGKGIVLDDGTDITDHEIIGATKNNVKAILCGHAPVSLPEHIHRSHIPIDTLRGEDVLSILRRHGYTVDDELHIHKKMSRPFSNLRAGHAKAIVGTHLLVCSRQCLQPEHYPIQLYWRTNMKEDQVAMIVDGRKALIPDVGEGYIGLCKDGRIGLVYENWEIVPRDSSTIIMRQNPSATPVLIHSMQEFNLGRQFITNTGMLMNLGENKLESLTLSIDDFV